MNLGRYRVLTQLGAGKDGVSYRAEDSITEAQVTLGVLSAAQGDPVRWEAIGRRFRLIGLLDAEGVRRLLEFAPENDPPYVALEDVGPSCLASELRPRIPLPLPDALVLGRAVAETLGQAHRLGLVHGRLGPTQISLDGLRLRSIDFSGLELQSPHVVDPLAVHDTDFRAPEARRGAEPDSAADVYALGALLHWLIRGRTVADSWDDPSARTVSLPTSPTDPGDPLERLLQVMLATEPTERPAAKEVVRTLAAMLQPLEVTVAATTQSVGETVLELEATLADVEPAREVVSARDRLGRFQLGELLGQGGMGSVYRAEDLGTGAVVAIKVLRPDLVGRPGALLRFRKEARMLSEINNPHVTNLVEVNEDDGIHFLVLEYVDGQSLDHLLAQHGRFLEPEALAIMIQVAQGLEEAHSRGIIHRDIKPQNILQVRRGREARDQAELSDAGTGTVPLVKLSDFGLARHEVESESLQMTQTGTILGTPLYMAPEQCTAGQVTPRSDIYAMGATLFHLLAGRPPFQAETALGLIAKHGNEPPPPLKGLNPAASDGVCQVVEKALAKAPEHRYADAAAIRIDLERLLRGEPTSIAVHPRLPTYDPASLIQYEWAWTLKSSPRQLWPLVSNTERLNRAVGLPAIEFTSRAESGGPVRRFGRFRKAGITVAWEEHPFEWVEARRMGVLREYDEGPWKWLTSVVEMQPRPEGGTLLTHRVQILPRGLVGRAIAAVNVGRRSRQALDRVYRRIDAALAGRAGGSHLADPFEEPALLSDARRQRLDQLVDRLIEREVDPNLAEALGDFLATAPDQEVARIRPLALARGLGLDPDKLVSACLLGAKEGLLVLLWDLLCPVCRIPSEVRETLRALRDHGHCEACQLEYALDFASSVELIFRVHPEIRTAELGTYCIGGPAHSPHVAAQARVGAGERIELEVNLEEGDYRLRGPQLPFALDFRVRAAARTSRLELSLARSPAPEVPRLLRTGGQVIAVTNEHDQELLVRVERVAPRDDALTAARASSLALFRELFPGELLSPGQLIRVASVSLLVTDIGRLGQLYASGDDYSAFRVLHEHFRIIEEQVRAQGGALIKTVAEGTVSAFSDAVAAVRAAIELPRMLGERQDTRSLGVRIGLHRGYAMAATLNDHLDYFGHTVKLAGRLLPLAQAGELILTPEVAADPEVAALLQRMGLEVQVVTVELPELEEDFVNRVVLPTAS